MDPFTYKATVVRVVDGDTIDVTIQLGFGVWMHGQRIRLYGINAPEKRTKKGKEVKALVTEMIEGKEIVLRTLKDKKGKYGRWLGIVEELTIGNLNDWLVKNDMAIKARY